MRLTEKQLNQIIEEEFLNLINEEEIDEKLFDKLKSFGKGIISKLAKSKSSGKDVRDIGRKLARYKYKFPDEEPSQREPETVPSTALAVKRSTEMEPIQEPVPDVEKGRAKASVRPRGMLPPMQSKPQQEFEPFGFLTPNQKQQLLLSEPIKIGVVSKVGDLLKDTKGEAFNNLFGRYSGIFKGSDSFRNLSPEQKQQTDAYINTILKHLISTDRILKNPTFTVIPPEETQKNVTEQSIPSARQIEKDSSVFDTYIVKTLIHSMKQKFNYIPPIIIEAIVESLHEDGRLAISTRMYNQLKHTDDPRLKGLKSENIHIEESKSYSSFYNNWKKYTGVKI